MAVGDFAASRIQNLHHSTPLIRFGTQYVFDAGAWVIALVVAEALRYEFDLSTISWLPLLALCAVACIVQFIVGWLFSL